MLTFGDSFNRMVSEFHLHLPADYQSVLEDICPNFPNHCAVLATIPLWMATTSPTSNMVSETNNKVKGMFSMNQL
jgi:hypothetical protein